MRNHTPKTLVFTWTDPDFPSGSPAILAALLQPIPPGQVEVLCEDRTQGRTQRLSRLAHPVRRFRLPSRLWPFRRGARIREALRPLCAPALLAWGWWHIQRFRPEVLLTIYHNGLWILTSYLLAKLTRTPIVYYVHDPYQEAMKHRGGLAASLAAWLEPRSLRHASHRGAVLVLCDTAADLYRRKYGIESRVLPQIAPRGPIERPASQAIRDIRSVGFAGTIYDNNRDLVTQLAAACAAEERLCLKVWTPAPKATLEACGLEGPNIEVHFESDHDRLLEHLAHCDLLYLPLSFRDSETLPTDSLRYAFPTKVLDYCLAGAPILLHCPADYATAAFFETHRGAFHLAEDTPGALAAWLQHWLDEPPPAAPDLAKAQAAFDPETNQALFRRVLRQAASDPPEHCPACAAPWQSAGNLAVRDFDPQEAMAKSEPLQGLQALTYQRCGACRSLVATDARRRPEILEAIYRDLPEGYWTVLSEQDRFAGRLAGLLNERAPRGELWDVGCGTGNLLARLQGTWTKHGIEPGQAAVRQARERGLDVRQGTAASLGLQQVADAVLLIDTAEHLPDPEAQLRALYDMLRPGGLLAVFTGRADATTARLAGSRWYYLHCIGHVTVYSRTGLRRLLKRTGYTRIETLPVDHDASVPLARWLRRLLLSRARGLLGRPRGMIPYHRDHQLVFARRPGEPV